MWKRRDKFALVCRSPWQLLGSCCPKAQLIPVPGVLAAYAQLSGQDQGGRVHAVVQWDIITSYNIAERRVGTGWCAGGGGSAAAGSASGRGTAGAGGAGGRRERRRITGHDSACLYL